MSDNQTRMLDYLQHATGWVTAAELSGHLGVSPRSVRSYVTRAKQAAHPLDIIDSGPDGYQLKREAYAEYRGRTGTASMDGGTPQDRLYQLVRRLTDAPDGLDVYSLAAALFVSDSTLEADLTKVRSLLPATELTLTRQGATVTLDGPEAGRRRLLSRMFRDESARGILQLEAIQREFASESLGEFKTDLIAMLDAQGYFVNEYGTDAVLLHLAIAVDRTRKRLPATLSPAGVTIPTQPDRLSTALAGLIRSHFDVELSADDVEYLALLLTTRVITPGHDQPAALVGEYVREDDLEIVRRIVARASEEYLVDLSDEGFMTRLTLHVRNLINRANESSYSRNPLARSIKTSYPMIYELAVYIASELQRQEHIRVNDDEIAYIAMHVGAHLEQQSLRTELVTCAIVCPNYYDMHVLLRERIERTLGDDLEIVAVITRSDVDWSSLHADLVLTTIDPRLHADGVIVIQPFLTEGDVDRVRRAASRVRRLRRRAQIKDELLQYFDASLFLRNFYARDEVAMIRALGERMTAQGIIDEAYVAGAIERERMSSTAFTDNLAVPHAMAMNARRTSIAIVINDAPMDWGENRVNVVALIAFSASGRATFQAVFDQFVEVFAERADVQRLIKRSVDFSSFIEELVHMMDQ
ncbi:BglG family transcription antiterminator [Cryobacterium tepidiphilum]|uniref:Transcription antiterminator n=1 Tax=Cryobacterium tepidiphilum TaxID=2486026 RepID=A0A3M8LGS8_9MICO|nr:BglG family transcription antiterminator [Cryobacterium tepidiphilum]RNE63932.1 transcription antiterminator [Cryobacterium tepidiphilum]